MTASDVKNYRHLDKVIRAAKQKLDALGEEPTLSDKVFGSNPEYPYEPRSFNVTGRNELAVLTHRKRVKEAQAELDRLLILRRQIEETADDIEDCVDKIIFTSTMKGQSQTQIAMTLHIDQRTVGRRLQKLCE